MNSLNLLPWSFRRRLLLRVRLAQWAIVAAISCGGVLAAAGVQYARIARREQTLARLEARCQLLKEMQAETARIEALVAESQKLQSLLSHVENQELPLRAVGLVSRVVNASDGALAVQTVTLARSLLTVAVPDKKGVTEKEEHVSLRLNGKAHDNLAVADMVLRLRETGVFDNVHQRASAAADAKGHPSFHVECEHRVKQP